MPFALGIDLGSSRTTAAISRNDRERWLEPEVVALDGDQAGVASVLHVTAQDSVEVGSSALRALSTRSGWIARGVADRIGDEIPVTLGGRPYPAEVLTAALVGWVVDYVEAAEGAPASQLVVTHPAGWGPHRRALLSGALGEVNLPELTLLPRPVAAAESHAATERVEVGEEIAVHSLGADRFESAVLRRGAFGFELRSHVDGGELVGGGLFDDLLTEHVITASGKSPEGVALAKLRAACAEAKERLTTESSVTVSGVQVTRAAFEELIRPAVESTVQSLQRTIQAAGGEPPRAVVLVGGCGRIPLVAELVAAGTRTRVVAAAEPETALARGAALAAARVAKPTVRATALTVSPEPIARSAVTHTDLMRLDDLPEEEVADLGPPPPRPPVEIAPLEPPKRRLLRLGKRDRDEDRAEEEERPKRRRDEDPEFADLDLGPRRRKRRRDPEHSLTDIEGDFDVAEEDEALSDASNRQAPAERGMANPRRRRTPFEDDQPPPRFPRGASEEADPAPHRAPRGAFEEGPADHTRRRAPQDAFEQHLADPAPRRPRNTFDEDPADQAPHRAQRDTFEEGPADQPSRRTTRDAFEDPADHTRRRAPQDAFEHHLANQAPRRTPRNASDEGPADTPRQAPRDAFEQHLASQAPRRTPRTPVREDPVDPTSTRGTFDEAPAHRPDTRRAAEADPADTEHPRPRHRNADHEPPADHAPIHPRRPVDAAPTRRHVDDAPPPEPIRPRHPMDANRHAATADHEPRRHRYKDDDEDFEPARSDRDGGWR